MTEIDTTRPCVSFDGEWDAEHVATINGNTHVWVLTSKRIGDQRVQQTPLDGRTGMGGYRDIINAPQTREVWLGVARSMGGELYPHATRLSDAARNYPSTGLVFPNGATFIGWQGPFTITDQPQGDD